MQLTVLQAIGIVFIFSLAITIFMLIQARKHNREMRQFWHDVESEEERWINEQKP